MITYDMGKLIGDIDKQSPQLNQPNKQFSNYTLIRATKWNAEPTSASPSSIVTDITTRPIGKESVDRPSIHKITRYTSDGKPINLA